MRPEQQAFEDALAADRYDGTLHLVYADWLDEQGSDELAQYHRTWTPQRQTAEDQLRQMAAICETTYEGLLAAAREFLKNPRDASRFGLSMEASERIWHEGYEGRFWQNYALVTGEELPAELPVTEEADEWGSDDFFRCDCW